jgi:hypothetical protein
VIDYRSRLRRKNEEQAHLRRLEEQLLSQDTRMARKIKRQVAIAMSKQQQPELTPKPHVNAANLP